MKNKIEKLMNEYIQKTKENNSSIYAQMGALGVSPKHLKSYEDSIKKLKN